MNECEDNNLIGRDFVHQTIATNEQLADVTHVELWHDASPLREKAE
jgi:hypothetical protein